MTVAQCAGEAPIGVPGPFYQLRRSPRPDSHGVRAAHYTEDDWATVGIVIEHCAHTRDDEWINSMDGLICPRDSALVVPSVDYLASGGVWPPPLN